MKGRSLAKRIALLLLLLVAPLSKAAPRPFKVVIDPGHGGTDYGTVAEQGGMRVAEKDVTLTLALQVARELRAMGVDATLTRSEDQEVPLAARTAIANRLGADVFLSIHMNSSGHSPYGSDAEGVETYILNNTTDATSKRLANMENTVLGAAVQEAPENLEVAMILKDLRLDANLPESKRLACSLQDSLVRATYPMVKSYAPSASGRERNRGVKQALFHVLLGADMPSVLVEAGFLTNPRDRSLVLSPQGQRQMSVAIAGAVERFRRTKNTPAARSTLSSCKVH